MINHIKRIIFHARDVLQCKTSLGNLRSHQWPKIRRAHLEIQPVCQVCGGAEKVQVHHIKPFHSHPDLELDPSNLISLCEKPGHDCHLVFGHLGSFKAYNPDVSKDSKTWASKIAKRPKNE